MTQSPSNSWTLLLLVAGLGGGGLTACSGSSSVEPTSNDSPVTADNFFFGDVNSGGTASDVRLTSLTYGRLVQVEAFDAEGIRKSMGRDFVINQNLVSDDLNYDLSVNGVTGQETLLIKRNVENAVELEQFLDLLKAAGEGLAPIQVQDLDTTGTFSMLPRNSALVMTFDDLLRPSTITSRSVEVVEGYPPTSPFEARVFPSQFYGGTASNGSFYPTRIVVDMTNSLLDQLQSGNTLPLNGVGLPPSVEMNEANVQIRIPTVPNPSIGLTQVVTNLTGQVIATTGNGPVDFTTNSRPVTRAMRSGGRRGVIADPFNGFLRDTTPPQVVGATTLQIVQSPVQVREDPADIGSLRFVLPEILLPSTLCGRNELFGEDVISQPGLFARIIRPEGLTPAQTLAYRPDTDGRVFDLPIELITFPREWSGPAEFEQFGAVESSLETIFAADDVGECFVQILPRASGFPNAPTEGVDPSAIFQLRFSEPMDPESLTAFDSVTVTREEAPALGSLLTSDYVVGELTQSSTLREVTFEPVLDLAHTFGTSEEYYVTLADSGDSFPPLDLAGNPVASLPTVPIVVDRDAPTRLNGGRVSRFSSIDEEFPPNFPEWGGQLQIDTSREVIRPRPVIRQRAVLDNAESALAAQMTAFPQGVVTPFSPLGSKMQTLWRYADCGFALTDFNNINIDVEGLWWVPAGGSVIPDSFDTFEIRMSHCRFAPDEFIDPDSLFPQFQNSGLRPVYTTNILQEEAQQVMHPRERGYEIAQGDLETTSNGTTLVPFSLNRGIPDSEKRLFTWRDTRIRERSGPASAGVEPWAYTQALGLELPPNPYYSANNVQSMGLPLLMEFRNVPDLSSSGQNAWVLNLAVNSSSRPYFRAFSTGGVNTSGTQVFIDPDNENAANGGFSPGSTPPGAPTFGRDNTFHLGALDYVTRISQAHSVWFESIIDGESSFGGRIYSEPTIEPGPDTQPIGTSISFFYRGATNIAFQNNGTQGRNDNFSGPPEVIGLTDYQYDASTIDLYGDYYNDLDAVLEGGSANHSPGNGRDNFGLTFLPGFTDPEAWRNSVMDITGARYYQVRVTFISNVFSGQIPELSAYALTWTPE